MIIDPILKFLPSVQKPALRLSLREKLKWTGLILVSYFAMSQIFVYGVSPAAVERLAFLELIMGAKIGSLMTLGIGPIVTASIILQLLVGSKLIDWDLTKKEQRRKFEGVQKLAAIVLTVFEAIIFVTSGYVPAPPDSSMLFIAFLVFQLSLGGWLVILMDEVVSKWGLGSGISLFIAAQVSSQIMVRTINPFAPCIDNALKLCLPDASNPPSGLIPLFISSLASAEMSNAIITLIPLLSTLIVFLIVIYAQAIKVEIPLAFGAMRGFARNWPLKFIYTSNIPVILAASLLTSMQAVALMMFKSGFPLLGSFDDNRNPASGLIYLLTMPRELPTQTLALFLGIFVVCGALLASYYLKRNVLKVAAASGILGIFAWFFFTQSFFTAASVITADDIVRMIFYTVCLTGTSVLFSIFWVSTSNMDSKSVANQIQSVGMQIPGFRRDPRIIESVLDRYIPNLAVLGGAFVGILASFADAVNALGTGTGILLTVMIVYNLYEQLSAQQLEDLHPAIRGMLGK
ncbi:MAG: preprotein translocase subunit SecY [Candidatus Aenigmatarchaeota archaeon]